MELTEAVRQRRMVRAFEDRPIDPDVLEDLVALARYAPSAGRSGGVDLVVLTEQISRATFWRHASSEGWRAVDARAPGLVAAPVIILVVCDPETYARRYRAADKADSPLGGLEAGDWPVPFWYVDAGFDAMLLLLGAVEFGLGALFFHVRGERAGLLRTLGCPAGLEIVGAIALGYPRAALPRARTPQALRDLVHRERW